MFGCPRGNEKNPAHHDHPQAVGTKLCGREAETGRHHENRKDLSDRAAIFVPRARSPVTFQTAARSALPPSSGNRQEIEHAQNEIGAAQPSKDQRHESR